MFYTLTILLLVIILGLYYVIDPIKTSWLPKCMFHELTGLDCPACGNQRALHALLHGDIKKAFCYNQFFIISLPYLFLLFISAGSKKGNLRQIKNIVQNRIVVLIYLVLVCIWWIARNII